MVIFKRFLSLNRPVLTSCRLFGDYEKFSNFTNEAIKSIKIPGVTIVRNGNDAEKVLRVLNNYENRFFY